MITLQKLQDLSMKKNTNLAIIMEFPAMTQASNNVNIFLMKRFENTLLRPFISAIEDDKAVLKQD